MSRQNSEISHPAIRVIIMDERVISTRASPKGSQSKITLYSLVASELVNNHLIPRDCVKIIFKHLLCDKNNLGVPHYRGTSKSAIKRRARRFGDCHHCGKTEHNGLCRWSNTQHQYDKTEYFKFGLNYNNYRKSIVISNDISRIKSDLSRLNLE